MLKATGCSVRDRRAASEGKSQARKMKRQAGKNMLRERA